MGHLKRNTEDDASNSDNNASNNNEDALNSDEDIPIIDNAYDLKAVKTISEKLAQSSFWRYTGIHILLQHDTPKMKASQTIAKIHNG
ncbi:12189_t:CDS:2, partial [Ambispora leptoticha]